VPQSPTVGSGVSSDQRRKMVQPKRKREERGEEGEHLKKVREAQASHQPPVDNNLHAKIEKKRRKK